MAKNIYTVNVSLVVEGEEYNHDPAGDDTRRAATKEMQSTIIEYLRSVMDTPVAKITSVNIYDSGSVEVVLTDAEQDIADEYNRQQELNWDQFQDELDRRCERDEIKEGVYSMGDLWGPIEQLDEVVCQGRARIAIVDGWGDEEIGPVYSDSTIESPTAWDMFKLFDEALTRSNDKHHVFLEDIEPWGFDVTGAVVYRALTGS